MTVGPTENTSLRILLLLRVNRATGQWPGPASTARSESREFSWPLPPGLSRLSVSDFHCESAGRLGHLDDQGPAGRARGLKWHRIPCLRVVARDPDALSPEEPDAHHYVGESY